MIPITKLKLKLKKRRFPVMCPQQTIPVVCWGRTQKLSSFVHSRVMRAATQEEIRIYHSDLSVAERLYDLGTVCGRAYNGDIRSLLLMDSFPPAMCAVALYWRFHANRGDVLNGLLYDWGYGKIHELYERDYCGK
jgi:hypothetical protein